MIFVIYNLVLPLYWILIASLMTLVVAQMVFGLISDHRDRSRLHQESLSFLALGFPPRTVEEFFMLEGRSFTGWTSDSLESFLSPYTPLAGDLDGLAALASQPL